ncbi:Oidioi.mRNA.OKI2018_I69.chr1.g2300.t1.cds [Oikopleura dioica]|uniref:Oidioi.mRNA.OKI2018_I69.chr1.g2300.t1.cds n=1 Tax=Oikopleura dioica TaxID=34765 RepID=A0ABN7SVV7_OIKDI|nr:Oidioi.mRNA.OKI2018_I69.chr1.g2300.t1.cds [Oikopleura dioica]
MRRQATLCSRNCRTVSLAGTGVLLLITGVVVKSLSNKGRYRASDDSKIFNISTSTFGTGILSIGVVFFAAGVLYHCLCQVQDSIERNNHDVVVAERSATSLIRTQVTEVEA